MGGRRFDARLVASDIRPRSWGEGSARDGAPGPYIFAVGGGEGPRQVPPEVAAADRIVVPDVRGLPLRSAVARLHGLGLRVELHGHGGVRTQNPAAGVELRRGSRVVLR